MSLVSSFPLQLSLFLNTEETEQLRFSPIVSYTAGAQVRLKEKEKEDMDDTALFSDESGFLFG